MTFGQGQSSFMTAEEPVADTVGFIGLGLMGRPMAASLARSGFRLVLNSRTRATADAVAATVEGTEVVASPHDVARAAMTIVIMATDTKAVEAIVEGAGGLLPAVGPRHLIIDMGTTAVGATRRLAALVKAKGGGWVDAPVSGGTVGAQQATLSIMAGGEDADVARAMPLFEAMGKRITHVGGVGAGQVAKAANQVIVGIVIGAVAEALTLARRAGVDPAKVREALQGGFADSRILELHGQRMVTGNFAPGGRSTTQRKDLAQALDLAAENDLQLPITELTKALYERLIEAGDGDLDHSALVKVIDGSAAS